MSVLVLIYGRKLKDNIREKDFLKVGCFGVGKLGVGFWPMSKLCLVIEKANENKNSYFFFWGVDV